MHDPIKESFQKVKEDISSIKEAINLLSEELERQRITLEELKRTSIKTGSLGQQTDRQLNQTARPKFYDQNPSYFDVSTGNKGVPADRQTDQQTDRQINKFAQSSVPVETKDLAKVSELLVSLDDIRKDLRVRIKKLTPQEMTIFSTLYQLSNEGFIVDYALLAEKINLTESSIRDYIQKILKKGFPIDKIKENNKKIILQIPAHFKKMASLETLNSLREQ